MGNTGKLTRLPFLKSEELHRRLLDDEPQADILRWVNSDAEVMDVLKRYNYQSAKITAQNLSSYKAGAKYADWKKKREALAAVQEKTRFALGLAHDAGMDLSDAGDAIVTSRLLESLEDLEGDDENKHAKLVAITEVFARLRAATVGRGSLAVRQKELNGRAAKLALAERQMEVNTVKAFMKWAQSKEAAAILSSGKPQGVQMDLLHELMFGRKPD